MKLLFQFISTKNEKDLNELREGITKLGACYDDSTVSLIINKQIDKCKLDFLGLFFFIYRLIIVKRLI